MIKYKNINNGLILPRKMMNEGPIWGLGGVCDSNNNFVDESFYDGGWAKCGGLYQWDNEVFLDTNVIYMGLFMAHWGHFLVDLVGRLWYVRSFYENRNIKVAYIGENNVDGNFLEFFNLLGLNESQLVHITEPTRFRSVIIPELSFKSCRWYKSEFVDMFDFIIDKALESKTNINKYDNVEKVYFTRRKFQKAQWSEFGEEFFENSFNLSGYSSYSPENLSLKEQIYIWNKAREIVCINGTIPLNVIFCKNQNLKLVILNKTSIFHENPMILLKIRNITADFINIYNEPFIKYPKSLGEGPFLLCAGRGFDQYCEERHLQLALTGYDRKKYFLREKIRYLKCILKKELTKRGK